MTEKILPFGKIPGYLSFISLVIFKDQTSLIHKFNPKFLFNTSNTNLKFIYVTVFTCVLSIQKFTSELGLFLLQVINFKKKSFSCKFKISSWEVILKFLSFLSLIEKHFSV